MIQSIVGISLVVISSIPATVHASLIDLGVADKYTLAVGQHEWPSGVIGGTLGLGSEAEIFGHVAASSSINIGAGAIVHGDLCVKGGTPCSDLDVNGGKLDQLSTDILGAYNTAKSFYQDTGAVGIAGDYAIDAAVTDYFSATSLKLVSGDVLTIRGNAADSLIINVAGMADIGSGAKIILEGIHSRNVLFNFLDAGASDPDYNFQFGGAEINGTFLANKRAFSLGDGATLENTRFYNNRHMDANVQVVHNPPHIEVPEPTSILMFFGALFFLLMRANSKHN